jgi:hypothetical protein
LTDKTVLVGQISWQDVCYIEITVADEPGRRQRHFFPKLQIDYPIEQNNQNEKQTTHEPTDMDKARSIRASKCSIFWGLIVVIFETVRASFGTMGMFYVIGYPSLWVAIAAVVAGTLLLCAITILPFGSVDWEWPGLLKRKRVLAAIANA